MNAALSSDLTTVKEENLTEPYMTQLPDYLRQMSEQSGLFPGIVDGKKFIKPPPGSFLIIRFSNFPFLNNY